jgi:hypothetical protein
MRAVLFAVLIFLSRTIPGSATASPEVLQIDNEVKTAYLAGKFDQIDEWIKAYQRDDVRTASGSTKAEKVYWVLGNTIFLHGSLSHETVNKTEAQADKWIATNPDSRAARITKAMAIRNRAWNARGQGFAHSVTPDQWNAFLVYSRQARDYLKSVKRATATDPQWYATMLDISVGLSGYEDDFDALAEEALEAHPGNAVINAVIVRKNLPHWGGTRQALEFWADRIANASGADQDYALAYWSAANEYYRHVIFHDTDADWSRVKRGFQAMIRDYPSNWNMNNYARLACSAQDKETTREIMARLESIDPDAWDDRDMPAYCREWAAQPDPQNLPEMDEFILVEAYGRDKDGIMRPMVGPMEQPSEEAAVDEAQKLAKTYEGVQAYRLIPNPRTRTYERPIILFRHGVIPDRP